MKVAYYYHVPLQIDGVNEYYFPEYVGRYIDALSLQVEKFVLITHSERGKGEYKLESNRIEVIDLGEIRSAWYRHCFHKKIMKKVLARLDVDVIIVRSPTPLSLFIPNYINKEIKILFYVVGSYYSGAREMKVLTIRDVLIKIYLYRYASEFKRVIRMGSVVVNSPQLVNEFSSYNAEIEVVPSSILTSSDFYRRIDTCQTEVKKLIYVGRLEPQKGITELLLAFSHLSKGHVKYELHIVGEMNSYSKFLLENLDNEMFPTQVMENIFFHGFKRNGPQLNDFYRTADIMILPSYHEGFPRVIFEAMANSLPVISTNVGSIPLICEQGKNIFLVPPKSVVSIVNAVEEINSSEEMRKQIIRLGFQLASNYTLEKSVKSMITKLHKIAESS